MSDNTELLKMAKDRAQMMPEDDRDLVLALIAENEQLGRYLCTCQDCGGEGSVHTGDWHSYSPMEPPEPVMVKCGECDGTGLLGEIQDLYQVIAERDQLKAENKALLNSLPLVYRAGWDKSAEGWNSEHQPEATKDPDWIAEMDESIKNIVDEVKP